jgi:hypothetical protein
MSVGFATTILATLGRLVGKFTKSKPPTDTMAEGFRPDDEVLAEELDYLLNLVVGAVTAKPLGFGATSALVASSGTTTLSGLVSYASITLTGTAKINCNGWPLLCVGELNLDNAGAGAIYNNGLDGGNGTPSTVGNGAGAGGAGGIGSAYLTAGGTGANGMPANDDHIGNDDGIPGSALAIGMGGAGGASGGAGTVSASGAGGAVTATASFARIPHSFPPYIGGGASGGGGAAGDAHGGGSILTGPGGGGGGGGGIVSIYAGSISRGASTAAGCITVNGGAGGTGATSNSGSSGDSGGAGGGGGGGGAWIVAGKLIGSAKSGAILANGGAGGTSPATGGSGTRGQGGSGGNGGNVVVIDVMRSTITSTAGSAGSANSTFTGGAGGACSAAL